MKGYKIVIDRGNNKVKKIVNFRLYCQAVARLRRATFLQNRPTFFTGDIYEGMKHLYFIVSAKEGICHLTFSDVRHQNARAWLENRMGASMLARGDDHEYKFFRQINEFFQGIRKDFHLPISRLFLEQGTAFQQMVWNELKKIPFGATRTYGTMARLLGRPHSSRAVGQACGANPLVLIIPCHRVIATQGLGGFAGGTAIKHYLIEFEKGVNACLP